jgi:outer membrane protein
MRSLCVLIMLVFAVNTTWASTLKIGYVDTEKIVEQTKEGKNAKQVLEKEFNAKKKKLTKMEQDLNKMKEDLEKKAMVLSDEVKMKKQQELQQRFAEYQKLYLESQNSMQTKQREIMEPIVKKLQGVIADYAKKEGFQFILEKRTGVLFAEEKYDLTAKVAKAYNAKK